MPARESVTSKEGYPGSSGDNMTTTTRIPEQPNRNAAPERLELVREFVNTVDDEERVDTLAGPSDLKAWLAEKRLIGRRRASPRPSTGEPSTFARRSAKSSPATPRARSA